MPDFPKYENKNDWQAANKSSHSQVLKVISALPFHQPMPHGCSSHFQTDSHCQDLLPDFLSYRVFRYSCTRPSSFDIKQLFPPQGNICSSSEKRDLGTTESSWSPTACSKFMFGLDFATSSKWANRFLSSFSSTTSWSTLSLIRLVALFHVCKLLFFIGAHIFILFNLMHSFTNSSNRRVPMSHCPQR